MYSIIIGLEVALFLGIVIFIHELGHFFMAKKRGVKVEKFSLGFGPKIIGFKRGDTEYLISVIPFGGYVKMAGENPEEELKGEKWEYLSQPFWARILIVTAGPFMNFVLAFILFSLVYAIGMNIPTYSTKIGIVKTESEASKLDIRVGDIITEIDGKNISNWEQLMRVFPKEGKVQIVLTRNQEKLTKELIVEKDKDFGILPYRLPIVGSIVPMYPAEKAGLKPNDLIISIEGKEIKQWDEMSEIIYANPEKEISITVKRDDKILDFKLTPKATESEKINIKKIGLIGISPPVEMVYKERFGIFNSIGRGFTQTITLTGVIADWFLKLLTGGVSVKESLGGPILIGQIAVKQAKAGLTDLMNFIAFLSLNLFILNLLPVPIFDGGHVVLCLIEGIRRKPLSLKIQTVLNHIGFAIIILLMVFATYNDIIRQFKG
ncbi:MAG: RIP metalloprotease RseP [Candidatus Firestonebacteria bacterium]